MNTTSMTQPRMKGGAAGAAGIKGVSLIELMVALAIGSLLVLGLVEVFAASRTAYQLSEGLSRVQENGRFAMDYIQRDFRMGGHMGCVNDQARFLPENSAGTRSALASTFLSPANQQNENYASLSEVLRFDQPIQGYEATGAAWVPALPAPFDTNLTGRVAGSDILVLRQFSSRGAQVTNFLPGNPAFVDVDPLQYANLEEDGVDPGLFGIADCMSAGFFHAKAVNKATGRIEVNTNNAGIPATVSSLLGNEPYVTGQAYVYTAETIVYYVGSNAAGRPSLYRVRYIMKPNQALTFEREELVEGIESLQLRYGIDSFTAANQRPSGNMGTSTAATAATPWRRVGLVQVGLLARSIDPAAAMQRDAASTKLSILGEEITPPADGRFRTVYENSIAIRNRLFGL